MDTVEMWIQGTGGIRIRVFLRSGCTELPPYVLLHGILTTARLWDEVAAGLHLAGHTSAAVDLRGHGHSDKSGPFDFLTLARDVEAVIRGVGLDRPILVGHSWGAAIALRVATAFPELVRGLCVIDGALDSPSERYATVHECLAALATPPLAGINLERLGTYLRAANPNWPEARLAATLDRFETGADGSASVRLPAMAREAIVRALWDEHPVAWYGQVRCPVLFAPVDTGDQGWTALKRHSLESASLALRFRGVPYRVRWFSGDHDVPEEDPNGLTAELREMTLQETASARSSGLAVTEAGLLQRADSHRSPATFDPSRSRTRPLR